MQLALGHRGQQGVERVLGHAVELLDVEEAAAAHGVGKRARHEVLGPVAVPEDLGRVVVADELLRGELGVALDEHQRDAVVAGDRAQDRRLARAGRALQQEVTPGREHGEHAANLLLAADDEAADREVALLDVQLGGPGELRRHAALNAFQPADTWRASPVM